MTPTIDERLASVIRSLTDVIAPSLQPDAGLAHEQLQMCVGHLAIMRGQIDQSTAYEAEELDDARQMAADLVAVEGCTGEAESARRALEDLIRSADPDVRNARLAINAAVAKLVEAAGGAANGDLSARVREIVLRHERTRITKDRKWFAPFGFDPAGA